MGVQVGREGGVGEDLPLHLAAAAGAGAGSQRGEQAGRECVRTHLGIQDMYQTSVDTGSGGSC